MKKTLSMLIAVLLIASHTAFAAIAVQRNGTYAGEYTTLNFTRIAAPGATSTASIDLGTLNQADTSGAVPVLTLDQDDTDESMINFVGSTGDQSYNMTTYTTTTGEVYGSIKVEHNGTPVWIRVYRVPN